MPGGYSCGAVRTLQARLNGLVNCFFGKCPDFGLKARAQLTRTSQHKPFPKAMPQKLGRTARTQTNTQLPRSLYPQNPQAGRTLKKSSARGTLNHEAADTQLLNRASRNPQPPGAVLSHVRPFGRCKCDRSLPAAPPPPHGLEALISPVKPTRLA